MEVAGLSSGGQIVIAAATERPKAFVIHGTNSTARALMCEMLLEMDIEPVVLAQQAGMTRSIFDSFCEHLSACDAAIALLTADDSVVTTSTTSRRSRQNVIFELGYSFSTLGPQRVCLIYEKGVELPSDVSGLLYYPFLRSVREVEAALRAHLDELGLVTPASRLPRILFIDDDASEKHPLVAQLRARLASYGELVVVSDVESGCHLLETRRHIVACITDIVFRTASELGGVRVAEQARRARVPLVVITGHPLDSLGVSLAELRKLNVHERDILRKPATLAEHKQFLDAIQRSIETNLDPL